jgi:uncharacterized protein
MAVAVRAARGLVLAFAVATCGYASVSLPADPSSVSGYIEAARRGNLGATKALAFLLLEGGAGGPDPGAALPWLRICARGGDADAQAALGDLYREGRSVEADPEEAARWYARAVDRLPYAAWRLGQFYEHGDTGHYDPAEAFRLYLASAESGSAPAQNSLGNLYLAGIGVPQDFAKALDWYTRAANLGSTDALLNLAGMFLHGLGVARDFDHALALVQEARRKHARDADSFIEEIERQRHEDGRPSM